MNNKLDQLQNLAKLVSDIRAVAVSNIDSAPKDSTLEVLRLLRTQNNILESDYSDEFLWEYYMSVRGKLIEEQEDEESSSYSY